MSRLSDSYSRLQISLHWLVAILVTAAYFTGDGMGRVLRQKAEGSDPAMPVHVWIGLAVLAIVLLRFAIRMTSGAPGPLPDTGDTEAKLRHWGHVVLYVLMLGVPLGGLTAWALANGGIGEVHSTLGNALFFLAGAHAVVALLHHFVRKDGTLMRMLRPE